MPESASVKWPQIKSAIASLDKPELFALLKDLFDHSIESRAFLAARFLAEGVPDVILDKYRGRIVEQFFPKRWFGKLDLRAALYPRFQDRVSRLARMTSGIGWGYSDHVAEQIELLEAEVGEQWER